MAVDVGVPEIGESISEVVLLEWLKAGGEYVEKGEPVCVLETDKANVDLPAPEAGVLQPLKEVDETIAVGEVIARIEEGERPADERRPKRGSPAPAPESPAPGADPGPREEPPAEAAAGPPALSPAVRRLVQESGVDPSRIRGTRPRRPADQAGRAGLSEEHVRPEGTVSPPGSRNPPGLQDPRPRRRLHATPEAAPVPTAPDAASEAGAPAAPEAAPAPRAPAPAPQTKEELPPPRSRPAPGERREPMSRIRKRIAQRLTEAQRVAAMLTTFNEVDLSEVMALRARHKERFQEKHGVSLGLMSFFSRASVIALREIPALNARIEGDDIVYQEFVNLGIAVSTERGLLVPVVRGAGSLSMAGIEAEIKRLAAAAREGGLSLDDLSGGTFTITNGGLFGSMMSTPILTPPQTGILGMHAIKDRPVAVDGQVAVRPMMYLALTYDHRLVDGEQSVRFLVRVKELLEDPARLALEI